MSLERYLRSKETICPRQPDLVYDIGVSANPGVNLCLKVSLQSSDRYFLKKVRSNHQLDHSLGLGKKKYNKFFCCQEMKANS